MPKYHYRVELYTDTGVVEADDEEDAEHQAREYVAQQFSDAITQADWYITPAPADATADNRP